MIGRFIIRSLFKALSKLAPPFLKVVLNDYRLAHRRFLKRKLALNVAVEQGFDRRQIKFIRHVTFDELSSDGYDIRRIDDGAVPFDLNGSAEHEIPDHWKGPIPAIAPKIATFQGAILFMDGSALLPGRRYCLADPTFAARNWRERSNRPALRYIDPETDEGLVYVPKRRMTIPGRCFSARHSHPDNFCHFVHDVLTRIYYEDLGALDPKRDKVIAPTFRFPMQEILFEKIFEKYEIVQAPASMALEVEELRLPANLTSMSRFNSASMVALSKRMRRIMENYAKKERNKICVSRRDGKRDKWREFGNEEAYEDLISKLGYCVVNVSDIDPDTQLELWANTTDIVGIHGAGMMNMIMMRPKGIYTEIGDMHNTIGRCAIVAGHQVRVIPSIKDSLGNAMIDLKRLEGKLNYHT